MNSADLKDLKSRDLHLIVATIKTGLISDPNMRTLVTRGCH